MHKIRIIAFVLAFLALPASAQDVRLELADTGVLKHSSHGDGIEMRILPVPFPDGLFESEELDDLLSGLCNHYAPHVIPFVQRQAGIEEPNFIAVRIISGGSAGRYVLQAYAISDGGCGDRL